MLWITSGYGVFDGLRKAIHAPLRDALNRQFEHVAWQGFKAGCSRKQGAGTRISAREWGRFANRPY
jgi:hypothetical protein